MRSTSRVPFTFALATVIALTARASDSGSSTTESSGAPATPFSAPETSASPTPTATLGAMGIFDSESDGESSEAPAPVAGDGSAMDQAAVDGMPALGIVECPQLETYEYTPTSGNTTWRFVYSCADRNAYDETAAALVDLGYDSSPMVISSEGFISERNHFQADANGGSTEVQLSLEGFPEELEFEIFVTLTLP